MFEDFYDLNDRVIEWAEKRHIFEKSDPKSQLLKTITLRLY